MPHISTLVGDIHQIIKDKKPFAPENISAFANSVGMGISNLVAERQSSGIRASTIGGHKCDRQRWYMAHSPELAEPLPPSAVIKYQFGHILEAMLLMLAREAGHEVEGEQDELVLGGVVGHRDVVIDGRTVDIKSASSFQFAKFKSNEADKDDPFGYLDQLNFYSNAAIAMDDLKVRDREYHSFLVIDKTLGHVVLDTYKIQPKEKILASIERVRSLVNRETPPPCTCEIVPKGKSGNMGLGLTASYSPYKYLCHPKLRTFLYSKGPEYLTRVVKMPDVVEVDKNGNVIRQPS